jgi:hypothetical protein
MRVALFLLTWSALLGVPSAGEASPDGRGASAGYRLIGDAVAVRFPQGGVDVYWRMNRALPRERRDEFGIVDPGAPLKVMAHALLRGRGMSWGCPLWMKPRARHCYYQQIDDAELAESSIGTRIRFTVRIRGRQHAVRGHALLIGFTQGERRYERRLGC